MARNNTPAIRKPSQADLKEAAIIQAEILYHYRFIAGAIGVDEDTLAKWRKKDSDFAVRLEQARTRFTGKHIKRARSEFLLERLQPEIFKERKDITSDDKPLTVALVEFVDGDDKSQAS